MSMVTVILMIIDHGGRNGYGDEHCTAPVGVYKHEPSSQGIFQFHLYVNDDVMVYHLVENANVNQIPKALSRSMLIVMVMVMRMVMMMRSFTTW